ncbi:hypothetical protein C1645_835785 [Glomus cerebriforme]|uniref:Uncharacterized protein n=1 Tax=Glomus cerebriforme TaxID=658196 RepID=A0A397S9J9_9GLOM|nr:hypothetical protein C1645_835785 [Glomus cerebriforme]
MFNTFAIKKKAWEKKTTTKKDAVLTLAICEIVLNPKHPKISSQNSTMMTPKVWSKLVNPTDNWTKVSLEEVEDPHLKAINNIDSPNEAVELYEKEKLISVIRHFNIEETNIKDSFAKNIKLFITALSKPISLLYTYGASWEFQASENLAKLLKNGIEDYYYNFQDGKFDKNLIPIYLILAGAKTEKS